MSRRRFIEEHGGKCRNWTWSWSFVNHDKHWVIFGAWEDRESEAGQEILSDSWEMSHGRKAPAYSQSLDHIKLVQNGYALFTFKMKRALAHPGTDRETSKIDGFEPKPILRTLRRIPGGWLAVGETAEILSSDSPEKAVTTFPEGIPSQILGKAYQRSRAARDMCLFIHGTSCKGCGVNLGLRYGELAQGFIHVHHLIRLADIGVGYQVDAETDLIPVCPNCHSIIHLKEPMLSMDELRSSLESASSAMTGTA